MVWALPAARPPLWSSSSCSGNSRFSVKAVSISPLSDEEDKAVLVQNKSSAAATQESSRFTKWRPQYGRIEQVLKLLQKKESVEAALEGWDKPLSGKHIVTIFNNLSSLDKALQFFEWLKARRDVYEINKFTYNVVLKTLRNGKRLAACEELVEEMMASGIEPDNFTYSTLINCAKRCNQPEQAIKWFETMKTAGIVPDEVTYNVIIDVYGRVGRANDAIELYEKLRSLKWKLDTVTYGALANVYARTGDYQAIMEMFQEMKALGARPNAVIMNTLIGTLSKAGKINQAKKAFGEMQSYGLEPTPVTLSILIEMYNRVGAYEQAFETYETVKSEGWKCDVAVYNSLLKACVEGARVKEAEEILQEIKRVGCKADHLTYRTTMNTYATCGDVSKARELFYKVVELTGKPDTPLYSILVRACKQADDMSSIREVCQDMVSKNCAADERFTGMLLSCISCCRSDKERQSILECLKTANPSLHDLVLFLLDRDADKGEGLAQRVESFIRLYRGARKPLCNSLIDICWMTGMKQAAHRIFSVGVFVGAYEGLQASLPSLWRLNVRTLSFTTAECALESWFSSLTLAVKHEEELPQDLVIETGVGRIQSVQRLHVVVGEVLQKMGAPFTMSMEPSGYYYATGRTVEKWIKLKLASSSRTSIAAG